MTRTQLITLKVLQVLYAMPNGQCAEGVLQSSVDLLIVPNTLDSEFREALKQAEKDDLILGVRTHFHGVKWRITDLGRAEHIESSK